MLPRPMLKHRLVFGAIFIAALVGMVYGDARLSESTLAQSAPEALRFLGMARCDGAIVTMILVVLVILGTRELRRLFGAAGHEPLICWPMLVNVALVIIPFITANGLSHDRQVLRAADAQYTVVCLTVALFGVAYFVALRKKTSGSSAAMGTTLFIIFYLGLLPQFIVRLRLLGPPGAAWLVLYFVATVKLCDIGAYFTGRFLGRHKLIEWLSPKKTVEGLVGGILASVVFAVCLPWLVRAVADPGSVVGDLFPGPLRCVTFGMLMALVGQGGDLLESLFKRDAGAKDSACSIPAFGGVLDMLDSPLLTAPLAYWILVQ